MGLPYLIFAKGTIVKVEQLLFRILKLLFFASLVVNIAACSSDYLPSQNTIEETLNFFETQKVTCPTARILREGESYLTFDEQLTTKNPKAIAEITTVEISCRLGYPKVEEKNPLSKFAILVTDVNISILYPAHSREERAMIPPIPYFVALVNRFGKITTKKIFEAEGPSKTEDLSAQTTVIESILVNIPIDHLGEAEGYEMLVGFQLSEQQIEHARTKRYE